MAGRGFGDLLREHRTIVGLTQEELAAATGMSPRAISNIERGKTHRPYTRSVHALADALGLDTSDRAEFVRAARGERASTRPLNSALQAGNGHATLRQLPAGIRDFTGRSHELGRLLGWAERAVAGEAIAAICAIDGMAGVGKSALAVHLAHQLAPRFPDGQLFVNLRGHAAGLSARTAGEALDFLLRSLGVPLQAIPSEPDERAAFYRARLAGTRTLILLDDASSSTQVRPLIPGAAGSIVLVTSRTRLAGLDDAHTISLDALPEDDAVALLCAVAGPGRVPPRHPSVGELVTLCGRLPLAIRIVAARLRHRGQLPISDIAMQLRDELERLARLRDEDRDVAAAFGSSYTTLPPAERYLFRGLGLVPGMDFDAYAAANLAGTDVGTAERLLASLLDHNMLLELGAGRYRLHDLLRAYARLLWEEGPRAERQAATSRFAWLFATSCSGTPPGPAAISPCPSRRRPSTIVPRRWPGCVLNATACSLPPLTSAPLRLSPPNLPTR